MQKCHCLNIFIANGNFSTSIIQFFLVFHSILISEGKWGWEEGERERKGRVVEE